jgi:outer membrane cobalamin receptor
LRLSAGSDHEARGSWQFSQSFGEGQFFNVALDQLDQHDSEREHWYYGTNGRYSPSAAEVKSERHEDTNVGTALFKWHNRRDDDLFYQFSLMHNETDFNGFPGGGSVLGFQTEDTVGNNSRNDVYRLELEQKINTNWKFGGYGYYTTLDRDIAFQTRTLTGSTHNEIHKHGSQLYAKFLSNDETLRVFSGVEYSYQNIDESFTRSFAADGSLQAIFPGADEGLSRRVDSYLLQARKDFSIIEAEVGVRYDDYSDFGSQTTPRVALIKTLPDQQIVKLIYSEAFRAAVSSEIEGSSIVRGDAGISPETLESLELVYSRQFEHVFVSTTFFKSKWQDGITIVPLTPPVLPFNSEYVNIADSESHGAELVLKYETGKWLYNTDLTYTDSEDLYRDIDYSAFPKYIWNARVSYSLEAETKVHVTQRVRYDMTSGHNNFSLPNQQGEDLNSDLSPYWLVDLGVTHNFSPAITGELVFKNVLDRDNWVPSVYNSPNGISEDSFSVLATINFSF